MAVLLRGQLDRRGYALLLRNLHAIYSALEDAFSRCAAHPCLSLVIDPLLRRCDALAHDLRAVHGPHWAAELVCSPAALRYVHRLQSIVTTAEVHRLVAHAYVRYMGDLSGGQVLRRIVTESIDVGSGPDGIDGTWFYDFGSTADVAAFKRRMREAIDRIPDGGAVHDEIVAEAQLAFSMHGDLFTELAEGESGLAAQPGDLPVQRGGALG